jgi:hypothetical protein
MAPLHPYVGWSEDLAPLTDDPIGVRVPFINPRCVPLTDDPIGVGMPFINPPVGINPRIHTTQHPEHILRPGCYVMPDAGEGQLLWHTGYYHAYIIATTAL